MPFRPYVYFASRATDLRRPTARILRPEVWLPDSQPTPSERITTKVHLSARETTACTEMLAQGRTLVEALRGIEQMRAFLAVFPNAGTSQ